MLAKKVRKGSSDPFITGLFDDNQRLTVPWHAGLAQRELLAAFEVDANLHELWTHEDVWADDAGNRQYRLRKPKSSRT